MNRRIFVKLASCLPFLGFLRPSKAKAVVLVTDSGRYAWPLHNKYKDAWTPTLKERFWQGQHSDQYMDFYPDNPIDTVEYDGKLFVFCEYSVWEIDEFHGELRRSQVFHNGLSGITRGEWE